MIEEFHKNKEGIIDFNEFKGAMINCANMQNAKIRNSPKKIM